MAMAELSPRHKVVTGVRVFGPTGAAGPGPCIRHPPAPPPPPGLCVHGAQKLVTHAKQGR